MLRMDVDQLIESINGKKMSVEHLTDLAGAGRLVVSEIWEGTVFFMRLPMNGMRNTAERSPMPT